jgi:AcrR family transcriptional regulator
VESEEGWVSDSGNRRLRADALHNRQRVIDAMVALFSEGAGAPTMEEVAERAGIGKATLYRGFRSQAELMDAVAVHQLGQLRRMCDERMARGGDPVAVLADLVYGIFDYNRVRGLYLEVVRRGRPAPEVAEALMAANEPLERALEAARSSGLIRADIAFGDLHLLAGGSSLRLSLSNAPRGQWMRAGYLVLTALGVPGDRLRELGKETGTTEWGWASA